MNTKTLLLLATLLLTGGCAKKRSNDNSFKISLVNSPNDIVSKGAHYLADQIKEKSKGAITPKVYPSGILSGGKGQAEIEMCQQGMIEMHLTSSAYLANLVPKISAVSLPFMFESIEQVGKLLKSNSPSLEAINEELSTKKLRIIAWWPRGFRQLTISDRPVKTYEDFQGLKLRVMTNLLYVDIINALGANPVPMAWGEVYNALQLKTIDGQENAEDVIYSSKIYEAQAHMTVWDYSTDLEVVLVNLDWWNSLEPEKKNLIQTEADDSVSNQEEVLKANTKNLRSKLLKEGLKIHIMAEEEKKVFKKATKPVWEKYEEVFTKEYLDAFLLEINAMDTTLNSTDETE